MNGCINTMHNVYTRHVCELCRCHYVCIHERRVGGGRQSFKPTPPQSNYSSSHKGSIHYLWIMPCASHGLYEHIMSSRLMYDIQLYTIESVDFQHTIQSITFKIYDLQWTPFLMIHTVWWRHNYTYAIPFDMLRNCFYEFLKAFVKNWPNET